MNDKPYDVFLSYSSTDRGFVRAVAERLHKEAKLRVWFDEWSIPPGDPWQEALELGLEESASVVVFLGPQGIRLWQNEEMRSALETRAADPTFRVVPAILPGAQQPFKESSLPRFLRRLIWVEFASEADENAFWRIQCGIAGRPPGRSRSEAEGTALHKLPYRGLEVFREEDRDLFFGREAVVERLLRYFEEHRFLAVFGPSGSGKSSVVQAGLLSHLREDGELITLFTPGERPLEELAFSLHRLSPQQTTEGLLERLQGDGLHFVARELIEAEKARGLVVVIDQFEELFTLCKGPDRRKEFQDILLRAVDRPNPAISLILTLRSDFLGKFATHPDFNTFVTDHLVQLESMGEQELRAAIATPAQVVGLEFEKGLVDQILRDAQEASEVLPLLEHALLELVNRRDGRRLSLAAYRGIGGIEGALVVQAEAEFAKLTDSQRDTLRKIFVLCLIQPGEGSEDTRRRANKDEVLSVGHDETSTESLLSQWTKARLLTTRRERGVDWVEVSHEALIRRWERIYLWMEEGRETARLVGRLRQASNDWLRGGKSPDYLFQGVRLAQAEEVLKKHEIPWQEQDFIQASIARRDKLRLDISRRNRLVFLALVAVLIVVSFLAVRWRSSETISRNRLARNFWKQSQDHRANSFILEAVLGAAEAISLGLESNLSKNILTDMKNIRPRWELDLIYPHHGSVLGAAFNAEESCILTWSADGTAQLWNAQSGEPIGATLKHDRSIIAASFSSKGTVVLTWSYDGTARLWDAGTGKPIGTSLVHDGTIYGARTNLEENQILTWSADGTARLWDAGSGKPIGDPLRHRGRVYGAKYNSDETQILTWSTDGTARLWSVQTGKPIGVPLEHAGTVYGAKYNSDETQILTWSYDSTARLWKAVSGEPIVHPLQHEGSVAGADFSADETRILTWSDDGTVRLWNARSGLPIGIPLQHEGSVVGANFSADETRILTWSEDGTARLWSALDGKLLISPLKHKRRVVGAILNLGETEILTWSEDGTARLWSAQSADPIGTPLKHGGAVSGAMFNSDETRILTWSDDGNARLWNVRSKADRVLLQHKESVSWGVFNSDDTRILTWSDDGTVRLWNSHNGGPIGAPMRHAGLVSGARFNSDDTRILTWSDDGTVRLWNSHNGEPIGTPLRHEGPVSGARFNSDDTRILTWGDDGIARLWNAKSGEPVAAAMVHQSRIYWARFNCGETQILTGSDSGVRLWNAFSGAPIPLNQKETTVGGRLNSDGTRILTWGDDGTVRLWNAKSGKPIGTRLKHEGLVSGARFNWGDTRILTWSGDGSARLWSAKSGEPIGTSLKHEGRIIGARFNSDDTRILTWSDDGTARLWKGATGAPTGKLLKHEPSVSSASFHSDDTRILTWSDDGTLRLWSAQSGEFIGAIEHERRVNGARISSDGTRILTWSDNSARLWSALSGTSIGDPLKHESYVNGARFNSDGTQILTWSLDSTAQLWDIESDFDIPGYLFKLQINALTGAEYLAPNQEAQVIETREWRRLAKEYDEAARSHYRVCKYPEHNLWRRFNLEEAEKIRPLVPR